MRRFVEIRKIPGHVMAMARKMHTTPGGVIIPGSVDMRDLEENARKFKGVVEDPTLIGYDQQTWRGLAGATVETQNLDYVGGGTDSVDLSKDRVITSIMLVADPYQHDVTTAVIVPVQDAADKVISALSINGKISYYNLSSTLLFLKALSAVNKVTGRRVSHEDLATAVAADNQSIQAWVLQFGALNDWSMYDITAGIPAEDETSLVLQATFGADNLIAVVAANGTVDPATDIYVVNYGVQGLPKSYRDRMPVPDFRHDIVTNPTSQTVISLQPGRYLKRTTIINLGVVASNNAPRNDANVTNLTVSIKRPTLTQLFNRVRWETFKNMMAAHQHQPLVDADGTASIQVALLDGVAVIDWRKFTGNPYGLNLYPFQNDDIQITLEMGVTTGSVHMYHEYYALPDPAIAEAWGAFRPQ